MAAGCWRAARAHRVAGATEGALPRSRGVRRDFAQRHLDPRDLQGIGVIGVGGLGGSTRLSRAGLMEVMPIRMTAVPRLLVSGELRVDVRSAAGGRAGRERVAIRWPAAPTTYASSSELLGPSSRRSTSWHPSPGVTRLSRLMRSMRVSRQSSADPGRADSRRCPARTRTAVARVIATLIPDGATMQTGIGSIVDALPAHLRDKL